MLQTIWRNKIEKANIWDIEGTEFPAGRRTRVILDRGGAMEGNKFCQSYVVACRGGGVPGHDHEAVESHATLKGHGEMEVDGEKQPVKEGDCISIPSNLRHSLYNTGEERLRAMFVYAPGIMVDHWAKEQSGEIR